MEQLAGLRWRKSTYSGSNGGGCIEVGGHSRHVVVRDTRDRPGSALRFSTTAWRRFTDQIKRS
jgi:hypothetical protein